MESGGKHVAWGQPFDTNRATAAMRARTASPTVGPTQKRFIEAKGTAGSSRAGAPRVGPTPGAAAASSSSQLSTSDPFDRDPKKKFVMSEAAKEFKRVWEPVAMGFTPEDAN